MRTYEYAVMDGNEAPDQFRFAVSCHHTITAAIAARDKLNRQDPNAHYYVIGWGATRWAKERPNDGHYPIDAAHVDGVAVLRRGTMP